MRFFALARPAGDIRLETHASKEAFQGMKKNLRIVGGAAQNMPFSCGHIMVKADGALYNDTKKKRCSRGKALSVSGWYGW